MIKILAATLLTLALVNSAFAVQTRQQLVDEINNTPGITWKAGVSEFNADKPVGFSKSLCGVKEGNKAMLDAKVASGEIIREFERATIEIPESFDSVDNWPECAKVIGDIRDQSNCGCCWAFGAAESASDRMCIATNATLAMPLSAQDTCFCGSWSGCDGGFLAEAWGYIQSSGLVTGSQNNQTGPFGSDGYCSSFSLPHCHHHGPQRNDPYPPENSPGCPPVQSSPQCPSKCDATSKFPHNSFAKDKYTFQGSVATFGPDADGIAQAIMTSGPVEVAFNVYSDFENYVSGVYKHTGGQMLGGHAVKISGWGVDNGVKYWKVANSWNPYWGEKGYFRIVRGVNECGIESQATASSTGATWGKKN
jgi:cathepsin B